MTQKSKRISWVYTVLLFHAALPDRTLSSKIVRDVQGTGKASLESKAAPRGWFQHWTMNKVQPVPGEYATVPGAFKYSAIVEVDKVRCSAAVIASKWVLSSTHCFSITNGTRSASTNSTLKTRRSEDCRKIFQMDAASSNNCTRSASTNSTLKTREMDDCRKIVQMDAASSNNPLGFAYAGGIKYRVEADKEAEGVQQQRLVSLVVYTESPTESDLRTHDIMLAKVGPVGFRFNEFVQPIRFTDQRRFSLTEQRMCVVVGFGDDNFERITLASLLKACTDSGENAVCVNEFRWPCIGDAGAPLVCQNLLVGTLRSEGLLPNDKCEFAKFTVNDFTFVGYYRDWIVDHAAIKFGVWRSGSTGYSAFISSGGFAASYTVLLLLHHCLYMFLK